MCPKILSVVKSYLFSKGYGCSVAIKNVRENERAGDEKYYAIYKVVLFSKILFYVYRSRVRDGDFKHSSGNILRFDYVIPGALHLPFLQLAAALANLWQFMEY